MIDAMTKARSGKEYLDAIKRQVEKIWTVMEDDTDFYQNGALVNGQEYSQVQSNERGEQKKYIPIFFANMLSEKD